MEEDEKLLIFGWITTVLGLPKNADPTNYNKLTDKIYELKKRDEEAARIKGIIEALEGVSQRHYGYRGEEVIDTYLSTRDRLRPEGEDPGFSLPVSEAIEFYKDKLKKLYE
jgi:hypothetical protein